MQFVRNAFEVLLMFFVAIIYSLFFAYAWPESTYGLAAWVQALGSIGAIFWAARIASGQALREETRRKRDAIEAEIAALHIMSSLLVQVERLSYSMEQLANDFKRDKFLSTIEGIEALRHSIESIWTRTTSGTLIQVAVDIHSDMHFGIVSAKQAFEVKGIIELVQCQVAFSQVQRAVVDKLQVLENRLFELKEELAAL